MNIVQLVAVLALFTATLHGAGPLRIICIGDSITQGGKANRPEWTYRLALQEMLLDAGINFEFIGSRQQGLEPAVKWPDVKNIRFAPAHEGYYGAKTAFVCEKLKAALPGLAAPDFALIHLGTNDQKAEDHVVAVVKPLEDIIAQLRAKNPKVRILVGHLAFHAGNALKIRPLVEDMVARLTTAESPVISVHHYRLWQEDPKAKDADTFDWAHPNPQGQRKMARAWFAALEPYLNAGTTSMNPKGDSSVCGALAALSSLLGANVGLTLP